MSLSMGKLYAGCVTVMLQGYLLNHRPVELKQVLLGARGTESFLHRTSRPGTQQHIL